MSRPTSITAINRLLKEQGRRICPRCGEEKDLVVFKGYSWCPDCKREYDKEYKRKQRNSQQSSWSEDDEAFLRLYYPTKPMSFLKKHLRRSENSIYRKAGELGVKKLTIADINRNLLALGRRICADCKEEKKLSEFSTVHGKPHVRCKQCAREYARKHYRETHKEK